MIAYRKSWFDEVGSASFPETWEEYREVGKKLKAKGRPIGQTLGHTFGDAPTFSLSLPVVVGRQRSRERRQDRQPQHEGDHRVGQVHDGLLEGRPRRGRPRLGRHQQQPRVPLADHLRHAQRRLDLHRVLAQPRQVHHREGRAAEDRHPALAAAQGPGRPVRHAHLLLACHAELFEEPEGGEGIPEVDPYQGRSTSKWFISQKGFATPPTTSGRSTSCGRRTR